MSDNGKTFKAAFKLLCDFLSTTVVEDFLLSKRIQWRFNLVRSLWMGGAFEHMVGSVKRCLRKVLGNARLTQDELSTVLVELEARLNSRSPINTRSLIHRYQHPLICLLEDEFHPYLITLIKILIMKIMIMTLTIPGDIFN